MKQLKEHEKERLKGINNQKRVIDFPLREPSVEEIVNYMTNNDVMNDTDSLPYKAAILNKLLELEIKRTIPEMEKDLAVDSFKLTMAAISSLIVINTIAALTPANLIFALVIAVCNVFLVLNGIKLWSKFNDLKFTKAYSKNFNGKDEN